MCEVAVVAGADREDAQQIQRHAQHDGARRERRSRTRRSTRDGSAGSRCWRDRRRRPSPAAWPCSPGRSSHGADPVTASIARTATRQTGFPAAARVAHIRGHAPAFALRQPASRPSAAWPPGPRPLASCLLRHGHLRHRRHGPANHVSRATHEVARDGRPPGARAGTRPRTTRAVHAAGRSPGRPRCWRRLRSAPPAAVRVPADPARHSAAASGGDPPAMLIAVPVMRSIARSVPCSAASQNEMATPLAPARAVRPMRCT